MKPILSLHLGHDANATVFDPSTESVIVIEFEKITGIKHYHTSGEPVWKQDKLLNDKVITLCLNLLEEQFGVENNFSYLILSNLRVKDNDFWSSHIEYDELVLSRCHHHVAHSLSAYVQSPFDNTAVLSWDGGGDDTCFMFNRIKNDVIQCIKKEPYFFSTMYTTVSNATEILSDTRVLDVAGKAMGLSAYGKNTQTFNELFRQMSFLTDPSFNRFKSKLAKNTNIEYDYNKEDYLQSTKAYHRKILFSNISFTNEEDVLHSMQRFLENAITEIIENHYLKEIEQLDNNLIVTGGTALNVLVNEHLRNNFPNVNIFVPPNPDDSGLSIGHLVYWLNNNNIDNTIRPTNLVYAGFKIQNLKDLPDLKKGFTEQETDLSKIASLLKQGKILGLIQGRHELGPRALGNRSILCDPSIPDMKDILNIKVKFREWFRPFAPVCRKEDCEKYFTTATFDNMEFMSFTAKVKEQYKSKLGAITHVDGTARLQTVTAESNKLLYDLLTEFEGVLLNTSFNIQKEPTLNRLEKAFAMLRNTKLDGFVLEKDGKLFLYSVFGL